MIYETESVHVSQRDTSLTSVRQESTNEAYTAALVEEINKRRAFIGERPLAVSPEGRIPERALTPLANELSANFAATRVCSPNLSVDPLDAIRQAETPIYGRGSVVACAEPAIEPAGIADLWIDGGIPGFITNSDIIYRSTTANTVTCAISDDQRGILCVTFYDPRNP